MFVKKLVPAAMAIALLAGCVSTSQEATKNAETVGGRISSTYGNASGKVASSGTGPLLGAFIGGAAVQPSGAAPPATPGQRAHPAPVRDKVGWTNPATGHHGSLTTTREGYNNAGQYCREFHQTVTTKSQTELAYGTACKQADGTWKIVANS
ncbi:RT0821/Lpp0805 family surface protein [Azospirillum tabaci]|uniref:RT0821/Lpp0805 family surface protein n=1 Tax=Azospirillum tabaci TaxID=2752310 RepID=UPI0016613594|nr:RT0821/Lpp0805 family surface protein [Azospirillum tabaci]